LEEAYTVKPVGLILVLGLGCRSLSGSGVHLHAVTPIEKSFGSYGRDLVYEGHESIKDELSSYLNKLEPDPRSLQTALDGWVTTLSFFVHIFPRLSGGDIFAKLIREGEYGLFLFEQSEDSVLRMAWVRRYTILLNSPSTLEYLGGLNVGFATQRKHLSLVRPYWEGVNFIPDLSASFSSNLTDYLKAQKRAFAEDILRADNGDPLFPGQAELIRQVVTRAEAVRRVQDRFEVMDEDPRFRTELMNAENFYRGILLSIADYNRMEESGETSRASTLSRQIRLDWIHELARKRASLKP
jgi:hypothetical protein